MSSITGLISAGGGGGGADSHIVTDPKKLARTGAGIYYMKYEENQEAGSNSSYFFSRIDNSAHTAVANTTANDTYVTLLDITSSNGGYLHWVLSNGVAASGESATVKFTVDGGTPVEITYQPPAAAFTTTGYARMFLGGGVATTDLLRSTTFSGTNEYWNPYYTYGFPDAGSNAHSTWDDTTNNVYGIGRYRPSIQMDSGLLTTTPYQRLEFTGDLKIEVKHSLYSTSAQHFRAACFYTLF